MKWVRQFMIIVLFTFLGEVLRALIPVTIPAGIYGMLLLFFCLCCRIVTLENVEHVADFFIEILPLCFIPAGVGLMTKWEQFRTLLLPIIVAVFAITALVLLVSGYTTQFFVGRKKRKVAEHE